ncbi:MAG: hypothetical protein FJ381_12355 [Verrucomicrobia bacterium]|nr:hypothetical protein [Verrucomicrobiota bacterium]
MSVLRLALSLLSALLSAGVARAAEGAPAAPATPASPAVPAPVAPRIILRQLLFAESIEAAQALQPDPAKGYIVLTGPLIGSDVASC